MICLLVFLVGDQALLEELLGRVFCAGAGAAPQIRDQLTASPAAWASRRVSRLQQLVLRGRALAPTDTAAARTPPSLVPSFQAPRARRPSASPSRAGGSARSSPCAPAAPPSSSVSNVTSCALRGLVGDDQHDRAGAERCGDTLTCELVIAAVTLIGAGGRGLLA